MPGMGSALGGGQRWLRETRQLFRLADEVATGEAQCLWVRELVRSPHHFWDALEIVERRRRRGRGPLQGGHSPRVLGDRSRFAEQRLEEVPDEDELAGEKREGEEARPPVQSTESLDERVLERVEQASLLAGIASEKLTGEDEGDPEEGEPEVCLPESLVELPAEDLREPEVDASHRRDEGGRGHREVEMPDDEHRVVQVEVHRDVGEEQTGEPAHSEHAHRR